MASTNPFRSRHVAAVPYPGRGHVNPMLNLCRLLLSKSPELLISVVVTEEWLGLLNSGGLPPSPSNLRFVTIPNVIPSEHGRANDFIGFLNAVYTKMEEPFERLMDGIEPKVEAIVADTYLPWTVAVGNRRNIPVYSLFTMSASFFSALYFFDRVRMFAKAPAREGHVMDWGQLFTGEDDEPLGKYIPGHNSMRLSDLYYILTSVTQNRALEAVSMVKKAQCLLFTNFYELESPIIDSLRQHLHCPVYPIGPSIPYMTPNTTTTPSYVDWLSSQPKESVLYVSLGSFLSVSATQMDEIALGLRLSGVRFLWVARGDSSRLLEMVGGMGIVVPWCDQLRVLSHPSVGGFLTHCGWNSTMESVFCGVPMLTFPIFWDQPVDSRLVVDDWKVGLSVRGKAGKEGVVGRDEIAVIVKKLMDLDGIESKEMRKKAKELRDSAHGAIEAGGSSVESLDSFLRCLL